MSPVWYRSPIAIGAAMVILLGTLLSCIVVVPETKQAVILRLREAHGTVNAYHPGEQFGRTGAGVVLRIPFVDQIVWVDKRVLDIELTNQPVLSSDQRPLEVDAYARFRVVDPLRMVQTAGSEDGVTRALQPLFASSMRNELGRVPFDALLSAERTQVMDNIQTALQKLASQYGVQIVDVRIKHADLPTGAPLDAAYARMRTARAQEAATIRAQGRKDATIIRATANAQAAQIYSQSYGKDPEFYDFYRSMQSYRNAFLYSGDDKGDTSFLLSPQNSYMRNFGLPRSGQ